MARRPKSVRHLFRDKPVLQSIEHEISTQKELLTLVRQCLPDELAAHCVAARVSDSRLILHTDSPVWATRLRFLSKQLLSVMQRAEPALRDINIKLLITRTEKPRRRNAAHKSDPAAEIIHDCARFTKQASLREALVRLGNALKAHKKTII